MVQERAGIPFLFLVIVISEQPAAPANEICAVRSPFKRKMYSGVFFFRYRVRVIVLLFPVQFGDFSHFGPGEVELKMSALERR